MMVPVCILNACWQGCQLEVSPTLQDAFPDERNPDLPISSDVIALVSK
jgi:hypothetical protein